MRGYGDVKQGQMVPSQVDEIKTQIAMNPASTPSLPEIIEQTNRVLNSSGFRNSANQAKLLEFAITKALANEPISQKDIVN